MRRLVRRRAAGFGRAVVAVVCGAVVVACSAGGDDGLAAASPSSRDGPAARGPSPEATPTCASPPRPRRSNAGFPEVRGGATGATLWALVFRDPITVGEETKIVWRMTGNGSLRLRARGPGGQTVKPRWGPESHDSSTWNRPGDEWGSGWLFAEAGCWTIRAVRSGQGSGVVVLTVEN